MQTEVLILGGGAAGLFCAIEAGRRGRRVLVLERANKVGKKILMSGGGRCNFTNLDIQPANFLSANPHFCKSALARYTQWDFIAKVERHGIAYHEKGRGQLFCDGSSKQILKMLLDECAEVGVEIRTDTELAELRHDGQSFEARVGIEGIRAESVIVATGGLSIPSLGGSGIGYRLAEQFGHSLQPLRAGLVPLTLSGRPLEDIEGLAGVALPAVAATPDIRFDEALLFTHRGLSGPAILQLSSYWQPGMPLHLDLLPDRNAAEWLRREKTPRAAAPLLTLLAEALPRRLAQRLVELRGWTQPLQQFGDAALTSIGQLLNHYPVTASGTEGYRTAEVTLGGVDTNGLSSQTLMSKRMPNLYFIGEVVDVTGHLGGYNFQWAWASAHAAGQVC